MRFYRRFPAGPWWVDFRHAGRRTRQSTGTTDRKAAQEWADKLKAELWRVTKLGERPAVTWDAAVIDWLADNGTLRSLSDRKDQLRWASAHLAGKPLGAIDRRTLRDIARAKAATGAGPATVNRHMAAISAVLHHASERGDLDAVPVIKRRQEPENRVVWATEEQAGRLVAALPAHWAAMVRFSLATGLRRYNVTHLRWSAADLKRAIAWVQADEAKGGRVISVPLSAEAMALLALQRGKHRTYVFPGQRHTPVSRIESKVWRPACAAAGLVNFRWHDLRHTWATWHVQRGTELPVLQVLGGWRTLAMVLKYAHFAPTHVAKFADNSGLQTARVVPLRKVGGGNG